MKIFRRFFSLLLVLTTLLSPTPSLAFTRSAYFDWGPYYSQDQKVLGTTYSQVENLPSITKPPGLPQYSNPGVLPGSPLAYFDTWAESVQIAFTFDPASRADLRLAFANERVAEIQTLTTQDKPYLAGVAADNYKNLMQGVISDLPALARSGTPKASNTLNQVQTSMAAHNVTLQDLSFTTAPKMTDTLKSALTTTERAMDAIADTTKTPPIPEEFSTSIQKLKEQGLITPEEANKLYSYDSRHEVRRELDKLVSAGQFPATEVLKMNEAVDKVFPDTHDEIIADYTLIELRSYETRPTPSDKIQAQIDSWQRKGEEVPPPQEIRPFLYYARAQELAQNVDLSHFPPTINAEAAKFYPEAISENPTYTAPPAATPAPTVDPTPVPSLAPGESPLPIASPLALPTPTPPTVSPYLSGVNGPVPGDPTYFFKRFGETFDWVTTFDSGQRLELEMRFSEERLREASYLANNPQRQNDYISALNIYQNSVKNVSDALANFKGSEAQKEDLALKLESETSRHNVILEKGFLPPPPTKSELIAEIIAKTEDALDTSADALDRPAIPDALVDRLQDLKAQGLVLPEEVTDITAAGTRSEVREKIRKLSELGSFPPADAKKLDEAQSLTSPHEYNQLVEIRKVEELQRLRTIQAEFAQTASLKATNASNEQRLAFLENTIDPALLNQQDIEGRKDWKKIFDDLSTTTRPINTGQFPLASPAPSGSPAAESSPSVPGRNDALLSTCPEGAYFKQFAGCFWKHNDKAVNDYEQYRCNNPGQYWSFAAKSCVAMNQTGGSSERGGFPDGQPICPLGYQWIWSSASCEFSTGGQLPYPSVVPFPSPSPGTDPEEISHRNCPLGASYRPPRGCVWDETDKPIYDYKQYSCDEEGQYYSFTQKGCIKAPEVGTPFPDDAQPDCQEKGTYWSWTNGRCMGLPSPVPTPTGVAEVTVPQPTLINPNNPLYFIDRGLEAVQTALAFTPQAKEEVKLAIAKERFAEAYTMLQDEKPELFKSALSDYTSTMQQIYNDLGSGNVNLGENGKQKLAEALTDAVVEQNVILQRAQVLADTDAATPISAAISTTVQGLDRAADLSGEPPIPPEIQTKLDNLPDDVTLTDEQKQALESADTRLEARLAVGKLTGMGIIEAPDLALFDIKLTQADPQAFLEVKQLAALKEAATLTEQTEKLSETIEKTEAITQKLDEFNKTYEAGNDIPSEIRPYLRLSRIDDVAQTIRPDIIRLEDFGNRRDIQLAVATLQQEFKPTRVDFEKVENYRRNNPGRPLPPDLARIEGLSYSLGVRDRAEACFLPSPPFPPGTPCPPPGAPIPVYSYYTSNYPSTPGYNPVYQAPNNYNYPGASPTSGENFTYGKGPETTSPGVCPNGYHWMYDSGGWCMSNSGSYSSGNPSYSGGSGPGYTPYSPYYNAPGVPPGTVGYQGPGTYNSPGNYGAPYYYGAAPTAYSTNPPPGTVPGTGPAPTAPGQCPSGFHWMPPSGSQQGWCMADGGTYVPGSGYTSYFSPTSGSTTTTGTPPQGGFNCGSQPFDPATGKCADGACPGGFNWNGSQCVASSPSYYSPNLTQSSCGPGYYWDGRGCVPNTSSTSTNGSNYSGWTGSSCSGPPYGGCGYNQYWDSGTCSCRSSSSTPYSGYYSGSTSNSNACSYPSGGCTGTNSYFDWGSCSCRTYTSSGTSTTGSSYQYGCTPGYYWNGSRCTAGTYEGSNWSDSTARSSTYCQPPSSGCGTSSYWDYSSCSCRSSSSTGSTYYGGSPSGSCQPPSGGCGSNSWYDYGSCSCRSSSSSTTTSGGSSSSSGGSCPSGYHWMSENGGWCMSDGGSGGSTSTSPTNTSTTTTTTTTSEPQPQQSTAPAPVESTAPAPAESTAPAPAESTAPTP